jgi:SAM-dependent methyltransferase
VKKYIKSLPFIRDLVKYLDNFNDRQKFVATELASLSGNSRLLDAGCGSQQFRKYADHLDYRGQDFGEYINDEKDSFATKENSLTGLESRYHYGPLDYVGDIWNIRENSSYFDAVLCTEVFEHIPYPELTLAEFSRLLKPGGSLILTVPSNCLRHMDPYFFFTGFSDRWLTHFLSKYGFIDIHIQPVGDYYKWLAVEMMRTMVSQGVFAKIALFPAFLFYLSKKPTQNSINSLCMGYHVTARRGEKSVEKDME